MATEDDVQGNQSAFEEKVEKEDRELLTTAYGKEVDKICQVQEKRVQDLTEEPHETMKPDFEVESAKEFVAGNSRPGDAEVLESPMLFEIAGEENSRSIEVYNSKDMTNRTNKEMSKASLIAEEDTEHQELEVTITETSLPGTKPNAEESKDLNRNEPECIVREENIKDSQGATSAETTEAKDHLPDSTQNIVLDTTKLLVTSNQGAGQQNTFNTSTASSEDLHDTGLPIKTEDLVISSILNSNKMEPLKGLNSSPNVEDETKKEVQRSSDQTRNFSLGIECKNDHTEVAKENSQDVEVLPHLVNMENESTEETENLPNFLRNVSIETEYGNSHSGATEKDSQDAQMLPHSVRVAHETAMEVESFSQNTGNVSIEIDCSKEHGETTKGYPQDAERVTHSIHMEDETIKEVEISSDLAENVSTEVENGTNDCEVIESPSEDPKVLPDSVALKDETIAKAESSSKNTRSVSTEIECGSDPQVTRANIQDAEMLSHFDEVEDENIEKAGSLSAIVRNVPMETGGHSNYTEATKEEISENVEILPVNSLITPSMTGTTSTLEAEQGESSCEIKSTNDGKEKELLELKRAELGSANVTIMSSDDCPNKHEKEDTGNGSNAEQISSPLVNAFTEEILLKDAGPEKVEELGAHSGTNFEKEDGNTEDTSYIEPTQGKEAKDMVPVVAKENQAEVGYQNKFLEEVATVKCSESAMCKVEERPESSSNDSEMNNRETLEKEGQEQVLVELLTGEDRQYELSKGSIEANIDHEVPVNSEISNTEKDLEAISPEYEPGKENHYESLQEASMPPQKIDSTQHFERTASVEEQRLEGGLCGKKDSTSNASKSKAEDSLQEDTTIDGSNKEADSVVLNDTTQEMYETDHCPESTILENLSTEESSLELRSTTEAEADKHEMNDLIDIEDNTQEKDEVPSGKEENFTPQSCTDNKRELVEDLSIGNDKTKCPKGEADYTNDYEEIRDNDSEEAASELQEDHMVVEEVEKDTFSKDKEREKQIIAKEQIDTENSVESSAAEKNKINHEAANTLADDVHKGEAICRNDDEEIKGRGLDEEATELKEDQIVAKEAHMDALCKDEEQETEKIHREVIKDYFEEFLVAEENKSHHEVKTEATNPEDGNKEETFYRNDNEEIRGHDLEEGAPEIKDDHLVVEEAANPEDGNKEETFHRNDNEEIRGHDLEEGAPEIEDDHILAEEVYNDTCSKDEENKGKIQHKERAAENLVECSASGENKSDHKVKTEAEYPEADDVHKGEAIYSNDDEEIKANDPLEGPPELKEDQGLEEESYKDTFSKDDRKETKEIDKEEPGVDSSVAKENKPDREITTKETDPELDEEMKANDSAEGALELKEDQILAEESCKDTFCEDDKKETNIIDKEEPAAGYSVESSVAKENKPDHEIITKETNPEADELHRRKADHYNDGEIRNIDSEEETPESKEDHIATEEVYKDSFSKAEEEIQVTEKEAVTKEYSIEACAAATDKSDHEVKTLATNRETDDVHKGELVCKNVDEEIKSSDSTEGALELKEDYISVEQVDKDIFTKDDQKETKIKDKEEAATESVDSSVTDENQSDHEVATEATPEVVQIHPGKADHLNDNKEIEGNNYSEEVAPQPKEYRHIAEEVQHKDTSSNDEEIKQMIDKQEVATEYSAESSVTEENKIHHKLNTEPINPEADDVHKQEAAYINDDEEIDNIHSEEGAPELKEDQIIAEEAHKDTFSKVEEKAKHIIDKEVAATESSVAKEKKYDHKVTAEVTDHEADELHRGKLDHLNDDEKIKGNDSEEGATEPKEDQIAAEAQRDAFRKDEEKEMQKIDKEEVATEFLVESFLAEENKSNYEVTAEETNPEADELHKANDDLNDDKRIKCNDSEEEAPEQIEDQIAAAGKVSKETFSKDDEKESQIVDNEEEVTEYLEEFSVAEDEESDHEVTTKATNPEADDVHKGVAAYRNDEQNIESNDSEEGAPELRDQILAEECKDEKKYLQIMDKEVAAEEKSRESYVTEENKSDHEITTEVTSPEGEQLNDQILEEEACKDEKEDQQMTDKEVAADENSRESYVTEENKSDHKITTEVTNPEGDELHKGTADLLNDDEEIEGNVPEDVAAELKADQIVAEKVMQAYKDPFIKDEEKVPRIMEKREVAAGYLVESYVAEERLRDHKVTTEATNPKDDVYKQEAIYRNDDEEIKGIDSEEEASKLKDQVLAEEACKYTFNNHKEKEEQAIEEGEVAIEYSAESSAAEENKSNHMVKTEATNPEADVFHKGKADNSNDNEVTEANDPAEVAPESNEDHIAAKEVHEDTSGKDVEKETQIIDKEEAVVECLVESSAAETEKSGHKVVVIEATDQEASGIHYSAENIDAVEDKKTQNEFQESIFEDIMPEDKANTQETEELRPECDLAASSAAGMKVEESSEENRKGELDRERISQCHDIEKQIAKETDSSQDSHTKSLEGIVQESFQEDEANIQKSVDAQMNKEETLNPVIPISMQETSVEGSCLQKEWNVMGAEKETKDVAIEGTPQNDKATYTTQEGEKVTVKHEGNASDAAGIIKLAGGFSPRDHQEEAENSSAMPKISEKSKEKMLGTTESAEVRTLEGSLKKSEAEPNVLEPQERRTKDVDIEGIIQNDKTTHYLQEIEKETVKHEENADFARDTVDTIRLAEGLIKAEGEQDVLELQEIRTKAVDIEGIVQNDETTHYIQEVEKETVKHEENADFARDTVDTIRLAKGLPPNEYKQQAENSNAAPETSEQNRGERLDTKVLTEIRSIEGSLIQEEMDVIEPEREKKDLGRKGITQNDEATLSAPEEGKRGEPGSADTNGLTENFHIREYQEVVENSSAVPGISEEMNEKMLDTTESTETIPVKGMSKQEEWVIMEQEKETKDLHREHTTQKDEATDTAEEGEKTVKHEGNPHAKGDDRLTKGLLPRESEELAENSTTLLDNSEERSETKLDTTESKGINPVDGCSKKEELDVKELEEDVRMNKECTTQKDEATLSAQEGEKVMVAENSSWITESSEQWNEKILDTMESAELITAEGTLKSEERIVMEQEKEGKELQTEDAKQKDEATYTAEEGENKIVKHEGNTDAADSNKLESLPRGYQEQPNNSSEVPELSKISREEMSDTMEQAAKRLVEESLKQEELDVLEPEKETKDLDMDSMVLNDEAKHYIQEIEMETIKHEANLDVARDTAEGLPPREYQEQAENTSTAPKTSERSREKMLDTKVSTEIRSVEGSLKQEEGGIMRPEKEEKDLSRKGTILKVADMYTVKYEGNADAAGTNGSTEELTAREYQELAENSSAMPDISEERNKRILETEETSEIKSVEGTLKQEHVVKEQEEEGKNLHEEGTIQNDEATHNAQESQKEMIKLEGNPNAADTDRQTEQSPPREYQEHAEKSTAVRDSLDEINEIMFETMESKEITLVEGSSKEKEWDVMEPQKETKDLDREGATQKHEATLSAKEDEKETVNHEGNPDVAGTNRLTEEVPPREYQGIAESYSAMPDIFNEKNERISVTTESTETTSFEGDLKQNESDVIEPHEEVPQREYQGIAESYRAMPDIFNERNERISVTTESIETTSFEGDLKQNQLDVIEPQEETKDLHEEGTIQNDDARYYSQVGAKEMVKNEGNTNAAVTKTLAEELLPREHQELAENSVAVPEISVKSKEKMLNIQERTEIIQVDESPEQEEWDILEPEEETKDLDKEGATQKDEDIISAPQAGKETIKYEANPDAEGSDEITEGSREYQEISTENSTAVRDISQKRNETMLDAMKAKEIKLLEGISKEKEWDAMQPEKETKDLKREEATQDEAILTEKKDEKDTVNCEQSPDAAGTNELTEELPPREYQELAESSSSAPNISDERNKKMLQTTESTEIKPVEGVKQNELDVIEPQKETKDLHEDGTTQNDEARYYAQAGTKEMVKNEGNANIASINRLAEELPPREHQEHAENSNTVPDISEERHEIMLDTTVSKETKLVEGSSKQEEWDVMEPEKETRDLDKEDTMEKDDTTLSALEGEKETVKHEENPNAADINTLKEGLPPPRECLELAQNASGEPTISEETNETMFGTRVLKEIKLVEGTSKQEEWDVMGLEKETKDLDKEGATQKDEANISAKDGKKETIKPEGNLYAAGTDRLPKGLPPREYQELAENSGALPDIPEERNEKMLDTIELTEINQVEGISKQEKWDVKEQKEETKDLHIEGTTQNDEATHSSLEVETKILMYEGNANAVGTDRLAEELPPREYQEPSEYSSTEPEISEKGKEKMSDTMDIKKIRRVERSLKQEEWEVIEPKPETKDLDIEGTTDNDEATGSAQEVDSEMVKHERNPEALPPREYQELDENSSVVPAISKEGNEKMLDNTESIEIRQLEGNLNQDEWHVLEPGKRIKDVHIEGTIPNDEARHFAQEGETNTVEHERNADAEGDTASTITIAEGYPQSEYQELAQDSSAMLEISDKSKEKTLGSMEPIEIAVTGDTKGVRVQENMQLDNNMPTLEEVDQEDALNPEVQPRPETVELSELKKNSSESAKMPSEDNTIGEPSQDSILQEKDARNVKETTRISELQEEDSDSNSGNMNTEIKILNEMVGSSKLLSPGNDNENFAQENLEDLEVNSKRTSAAHPVDNITVGKSPEELREKPVKSVNETNEDHKKNEDVEKEDTKTLSFLEHETPHYTQNESTNNIEKDAKVINMEKQEDKAEKAGIHPTRTSEHEQINTMEKTEKYHLITETRSTQELKDKQGRSSEYEEKQQMVETVPLEMERLEIVPTNSSSNDSKYILQLQREAITESSEAVGDNLEPSKGKLQDTPHWEEKETNDEAILAARPREASSASLSDLLRASKKDISLVNTAFSAETEPNAQKETEMAQDEESKTNEEGEEDEDNKKASAFDSPVTVEAPSDIDAKAAHKKSHNILSGVGSKVKHSIAKVKKAITGKSSHPKPASPK